jgi:hypothetical protein
MSYGNRRSGSSYGNNHGPTGRSFRKGVSRKKPQINSDDWMFSPEYDGLTELRRKYRDEKQATPDQFVDGVLKETVHHADLDQFLSVMGYVGSLDEKLKQFYSY